MKLIENPDQSIGTNYPTNTGRLKKVLAQSEGITRKVALVGDSTLDNGFWVQSKINYVEKTHTVTHQTAVALANNNSNNSYDIGNFAVDGATTQDLMKECRLDKVLPSDLDHTFYRVHQLDSVAAWQPSVVVLSVAGNNYREALRGVLERQLDTFMLLLRITPDETKAIIKDTFDNVKAVLLKQYKQIIDTLIAENSELERIVLLSQYYPSITEFTPYFIYTGFSHLARAEGNGHGPFAAIEETMNTLYQEVLQYAATKGKEIVFADATSSLNPLGGNHTHQIEPNERGSTIIGRLIAKAIEYEFPQEQLNQEQAERIAILRMTADEKQINDQLMPGTEIPNLKVKPISQFISENRYSHLGLFFSSSNLATRYESAYHFVMGKQFDMEYTGLFAFGLLDLSLVTVMASYLWRVAVNDDLHLSLRIAAGTLAAPILLSKMLLGMSVMLALALPIFVYHEAASYFYEPSNNVAEIPNETPASVLSMASV